MDQSLKDDEGEEEKAEGGLPCLVLVASTL